MKHCIPFGVLVAVCATSAHSAALPDLKAVVASLDGEYLTYSGSHGRRVTANARTRINLGDTRVDFTLSQGFRTAGDDKFRATGVQGTVVHDWSPAISTRTSASIATDGRVFAKRELLQEVNFKPLHGTMLTAGARYARFDRGTDLRSWSLGAAQYFRGGYVSYRFTSFDIDRIGHAVGHLASAKIDDPWGSNQLWVGGGTALHDADWLDSPEKGRFRQVEYRRLQSIGGGVSLSFGVKRNWYETPSAKFHGTGIRFGIVFDGNRAARGNQNETPQEESANKGAPAREEGAADQNGQAPTASSGK